MKAQNMVVAFNIEAWVETRRDGKKKKKKKKRRKRRARKVLGEENPR